MSADARTPAHQPTRARRRSVCEVPIRDLSPAAAAALGVHPLPCPDCARLAGRIDAVEAVVASLAAQLDAALAALRADL
jgi:hypothetical protein